MKTAYLIPKTGLRLRDPQTLALLPPQGAAVALTSYWHRRLKDGDVSIGKPPRDAASKHDKTAKPAASRGAQE